MARRLGILGGSFDPIHLGHLRSAEEVREALALDRVYFVPAHQPPHKPQRRLADGPDRLAMLELAIADNPAFCASAVEIERGGTSYSVDTLQSFAQVEPDASLFLIVGMDAYREIQSWKDAPRIFELANVIVTSRPPEVARPSIEHLPVAAREAFCYDSSTLSYRHRIGTSLCFVEITGIDVSATAVRARVRQGRSIRYLVPSAVEHLITERGLYRAGDPEV